MVDRVLAVTGGIGAGKSTVTHRMGHLGAHVVDADDSARRAVAPGTSVHEELLRLVPEVFAGDALDRPALAAVMFADPRVRAQVEGLVHPWVRADIAAQISASTATVVVVAIPLLAETRDRTAVRQEFDHAVCVWAPESIRRARLRQRGMSDEDITARMAAQADDIARQRVCDTVLPNAADVESLAPAVDELFELVAALPRRRP